ncbi:uncharacterized protein LOC114523010 isoform X1 [Dendronephthya gigantea]|uniref:uncharacterized protein LOC114523010 isoform X1 n=1 Tax=Dendronephthya gigantea TaxID=151771 RepID=UPI00106C811F|nr:uncharacterized protein LOC114523010 isoform X1 [Dendronephthya gigantea]XP_028399611.1 uncharacterized protein LOC114523010 isoform X1 [Dendronephthya gigantea]XP_028399612.1 uncharacterized protein LOC114523010 isoform X1 [Dendronephthya gigantea]XP_028399613.1 uncharacterized protein LOC114523010 isoform X1 [Dendronephthya gigantea]XP_028399614.1 uncharacterized protein LOC114523010 isoform X1 [Dendronephthya gigantea]XP_028399615.1 uncharacterized protein LOC114523010 isoform X1 [Dendro
MSELQDNNVTQGQVDELKKNLKKIPEDMREVSLSFRALYSDQAVGGNSDAAVKFRKIRDDTRQDAMVYLKCVLPETTNFIRSIKEYFENYEGLKYKNWCEMLPDILENTKTQGDIATQVLGMHKTIMNSLKIRQTEAKDIMEELTSKCKDEEREYEDQHKEGSVTTNNGEKNTTGYMPDFVKKIFSPSSHGRSTPEKKARVVASTTNYEINRNAVQIAVENLIPALSRFIDGLQNVAQFFQVILEELESFEDSTKEKKKCHYDVITNSVRQIKSLCNAFFKVLPAVSSDFEALPSEDTDQNYVDKWLEKTLAKKSASQEHSEQESEHQKTPPPPYGQDRPKFKQISSV